MTLPDSITYPKPPGQERPYPNPTRIGRASFNIPNYNLLGETAYEIYGDLENGKIPLLALHGGPGFKHDYLRPISLILIDYGIPVVMYDQIGCGDSTHFPDRMGDTAFWTPELFMAELDNLRDVLGIENFDLLGYSWGGMLAAQYAITRLPIGLRKLIISDSPVSLTRWMKSTNELLKGLPAEIQETIRVCEEEDKTHSSEFEAAANEFNKRFSCRLDTTPRELIAAIQDATKDPTVQMTMFGLSDFNVTGSLRTLSLEDDLKKLTAEVVPGGILLMNGYFDVAQDDCMLPFFTEPSAKVKWIRFGLSSHCPQLEETEKFVTALGKFLQD
jgi:proline-specific peptidase